MAEKLEFDLSVKNNELKSALDQASKSASVLNSYFDPAGRNSLTASINSASKATKAASGEMSGFLSTVLGVAGGNVAFAALEGSIRFLTGTINESITAFAEQEDSINKLNQSLVSTGSYSEDTVKSVEDFATSLESVSKFSDDAIIRQVAFVRSLGATTEQAKQLVLAAANLSATLGGSLEENTDKLGKTLSGTAGRLTMYIPELKNLTEAQLRAGEAAAIINQKWSGAASNDLKTYSGQVANLGNTYNNLQEEIGKLLVKNIIVETSIGKLKSLFESMTETVKDFGRAFGEPLKPLTAADSAKDAANQIDLLNKEIVKLNKEITTAETQEAIDNGILGYSKNTADGLQKALDAVIKKRDELEQKLISGKFKGADTPQETQRPNEETAKQIEANKKRNAELLALDKQLALERSNFITQTENQKIANELLMQSAELERIAAFNIKKAEIEAQTKLTTAEATLTGEELRLETLKINQEKELAILKANDEKKLNLQKANIKARQDGEKAMTEFDKKMAQEREAAQKDTFSRIATLASENNKTLAFIGKAAAITQIAIDGPQAVTKALAAFPPPFNFGAAAAVSAAVAVQAARVAGVKLEQGGFIGGVNGASIGPDNRVAQVRDGEMVLNAEQQRNLLGMINSGGSSGDIVVNIDGREVFRAVKNQLRSGMSFA